VDVSIRDLQTHYASLSREALLEIDPDHLTPVARGVYLQELNSRGLQPGAVEIVEEDVVYEDQGDEVEVFEIEEDWLEHATIAVSYWGNLHSDEARKAELARDILTEAGIPCEISAIEPDPEDTQARYEYRVLVPDSLNLRAMSVLDQQIFNDEVEADWRAHFGMLTDGQLYALRPEVTCAGMLDRVARLKRAYEDEVARRQEGGDVQG